MTAGAAGALRWLLTLAVLGYAALALGSGFDRMSASAWPLERLVPAPLRAQADRSASAVALARGDAALGEIAARRALDADPVDPRPAALLGSARLLAGDYAGAEAPFRVAALFGWREPTTQLYWFQAALEAGDYPRAGQRLDALLRVNPSLAEADRLIAALSERPEGRAVLARQLAGDPVWRNGFFGPATRIGLAELRRRAAIATEAAELGTRFGCDLPGGLAGRLIAAGDRAEAARMWNAQCPEYPASAGLSDGGFDNLASGGNRGPFGWVRHPRGDLTFALDDSDGDPAITVRSDAAVGRLVVSQALALPPGRFTVRVSANARGRLVASLDCGGPRVPANVSGDPADAGQIVTVGACPAQTLGLWLRPGAGEITFDDVRLTPGD